MLRLKIHGMYKWNWYWDSRIEILGSNESNCASYFNRKISMSIGKQKKIFPWILMQNVLG